jgi:hypothetical protein
MSGISQGTAVIEASETSGAKMQARIALEQGKRAFLMAPVRVRLAQQTIRQPRDVLGARKILKHPDPGLLVAG